MDLKTKIGLLRYWQGGYLVGEIPDNLKDKVTSIDLDIFMAEIAPKMKVTPDIIARNLNELERDLRDIEIVKIQKKQNELITKQTNFSKILALATIILAFGTFFQIVSFVDNWGILDYEVTKDWLIVWMARGIFGLTGMLIIILVALVFKYKLWAKK